MIGKLNNKDLSNIISNALRNWDMNPMTKMFAHELAKEIVNCEKEGIRVLVYSKKEYNLKDY